MVPKVTSVQQQRTKFDLEMRQIFSFCLLGNHERIVNQEKGKRTLGPICFKVCELERKLNPVILFLKERGPKEAINSKCRLFLYLVFTEEQHYLNLKTTFHAQIPKKCTPVQGNHLFADLRTCIQIYQCHYAVVPFL